MSNHLGNMEPSSNYLSLKNLKCPAYILKLKSAIKKLPQGQCLNIVSSTMNQVNEVKNFCMLNSFRIIMEKKEGNCYYLLISRN
jgi:TusA-related sulfurtransferase